MLSERPRVGTLQLSVSRVHRPLVFPSSSTHSTTPTAHAQFQQLQDADRRGSALPPHHIPIISHEPATVVMDVDHEVTLLKEEITRLGYKSDDGKTVVKFGTLFDDDRCANLFEALVGTLRAAKKRNVVNFEGEILLQGVHNDVDIILL